MMEQFTTVDLELLRKYSGPGPRYTSYPTAPAFSDTFGPDAYREAIESTNSGDAAAPLSLYFHFPFCDTLCYFCGCTMIVTHSRERIAEYNAYLKREIAMVAPMIREGRSVTQLHWGGGTPSYLQPEEIRDVGEFIRERFLFDDEIEAGVEIDPRGLTFDHMQALREAGFNRVSMGVQDFEYRVQESVNRIQPEDITMEAIEWSRKLGFGSINIDLIYGLPFQTVESFENTVDKIIAISPDRLAVFNYAHVPWLKPHQKLIRAEDLPTPERKLEIFKMTTEKLLAAGYWNVGMDHFAKRTDELAIAQRNGTLYRNFQGYSTKSGCDLYGFGMSAIGQFADTYHQNEKEVREYYAALDAGRFATHVGYRMTPDDHIRKDVIMKLMCDMSLDIRAIEHRHSITFESYFASSVEKLKPFADDGLVTIDSDRIVVHGMGSLVIRNIAMCFDAYIDSMIKEKPIFSKTV
jgi:oxygen-independent coproporphyrinogen III oxidase